jgi:hypothetical protein
MKQVIFLVVLGILLCGGAFATDITACGTLSSANTIYDMINDITFNTTGTCISITGTNTTLNGHGYSIIGNYSASSTTAISIPTGANSRYVNDVNILNFNTGINVASSSQYNAINNVNVSNSKTTGINLAYANSNVSNSRVYGTVGTGIILDNNGNKLTNITVFNNTIYGISLTGGSSGIVLTNITAYNNTVGISDTGSSVVIFTNITTYLNGIGLNISTATGTITNIQAYNNSQYGIMVGTSSTTGTNITGGEIYNNGLNGIFLDRVGGGNTILDNIHYYSNGKDLNLSCVASSCSINLRMIKNVFDDTGDYSNNINISVNATALTNTTRLAIDMGVQPFPFGAGTSLNYTALSPTKFLNITGTGTASLDTGAVIYWRDNEVYPINTANHENFFRPYYYSSSWNDMNFVLNVAGNYLTLSQALQGAGNTFAIAQYNDTVAPNISIKYPSPLNNSILAGVGSLTFNFTQVEDRADLLDRVNCSLYINGAVNQTNDSTKTNTATLFTISNLNNEIDGIYNWSINCTDEWQNQGKKGIYNYDFTIFNISFSYPVAYDSPELNFNVNIPATVINGYFDNMTFRLYDLNNNLLASQLWTAPDNTTNSTTITFPVSVSAGYYRINATAYNNNSLIRNIPTIEIYPQATVSSLSWNSVPPASCYDDVYTHSNGQKFYVSSVYSTCQNLGLGQLYSNFVETIDIPYDSAGVQAYNYNGTSITSNNKYYSRILAGTGYTCIAGSSGRMGTGAYKLTFRYNLSGSLTHVINLTGINYTISAGSGLTIYEKLLVNSTEYVIHNIAGNVKSLPDTTCWLNSTGIMCKNATNPTVWGTTDNQVNYSINFGQKDNITILWGMTHNSGICPKIWQNIAVNNAFLEKYTGYGANTSTLNMPSQSNAYLVLGNLYSAGGTPTYLSSSPFIRDFPFMNISATNTNFTLSSSNISSPQPPVRILMYYNNQVIYPYLYYAIVVPNKAYSEATMGIYNSNIYLPSTTQINSYNNSIIYVYSREFSSWFLIPPFNLDPSGIYIVNLVYDTGVFGVGQNGSNYTGYTQISAVPELPLLEMCNYINNTYYIRSEYQRTKTFQLNTWINNTFYANITSAYSLNTNLNTANISAIQFYVDGFKRCEWIANQTSLTIAGVDLRPDMPTTNIFFDVGLILLVGLSAISPAILLPALAYNDFFQIIPITQMAFLTIFVAIISYITNWGGNRNMKSMLCLMAMGIAMLTYFSVDTGGGYNMQYSSAYGNNTINVSSIDHDIKALSVVSQSGINWNSLAQLVSTGIQLIIDLLAFIIQIPALMLGVLSGLLFNLSPPLATAVSFFIPYLLIGLIGWLVLKAYDMFQKPYMPT